MILDFFLIADKRWKVVGDLPRTYAGIWREPIRQKFRGLWWNCQCLFHIRSDNRQLTNNCWGLWRRQLHLTFLFRTSEQGLCNFDKETLKMIAFLIWNDKSNAISVRRKINQVILIINQNIKSYFLAYKIKTIYSIMTKVIIHIGFVTLKMLFWNGFNGCNCIFQQFPCILQSNKWRSVSEAYISHSRKDFFALSSNSFSSKSCIWTRYLQVCLEYKKPKNSMLIMRISTSDGRLI